MENTNSGENPHLRQAVDLARESLQAGDSPFGSVLVDDEGAVLAAERNLDAGGDPTQHPEFALARWAAENLAVAERAKATVYTSTEHCPMCSAAHAWVGLGPIVYASSAAQLTVWASSWGLGAGPVQPLPISAVAPQLDVTGPFAEFTDEIRELQHQYHTKN